MSSDRWGVGVDAVYDRWRSLERDWQSVVIGAAIAALIAVFGIRIPW